MDNADAAKSNRALVRRIFDARAKQQGDERLAAKQDKDVATENKRRERQFRNSHGLLLAFFALIFLLHILGVYLFTSGFLLTRLVLDHKSECAVPPTDLHELFQAGDAQAGCWHPKRFDKAVVIIIDALRYDFTIPFTSNAHDPNPHHFHNSFPVLYETASTQPNNAFLLPFIADPPTTTLQRLKGLTTGTLPTFIDAGSNFAGTAVEEDNLLGQLRGAGKRLVHLGDDTWSSLFPGYFDPNLTHAYDSFNVWDLHTVDDGVTEHLLPLLDHPRSDQWDVLFAHYLGVDHAGHRYGPEHPAMTAKLHQMDEVIRQVIASVDEDTLLVVMGDHGMDSKGDHGGESSNEVESALWMYSKKPIFGRSSPENDQPPLNAKLRPVAQIDLVPTLSLLMGVPIPFNNLGAPIEEAFIGIHGCDWKNLAAVARLTGAQIHRYQEEYALVRKSDANAFMIASRALWISAETFDGLAQKNATTSNLQWSSVRNTYLNYQKAHLNVCKDLWARFDVLSMACGIALLLATWLVLAVYARGLGSETTDLSSTLVFRGYLGLAFGGLLGASLAIYSPKAGVMPVSAFAAASGCLAALTFNLWTIRARMVSLIPSDKWSWACVVSILMLSIGFFSNSYTVWEDEILLFILTAFGTMMLAASFRLRKANDRRIGYVQSILFIFFVRVASFSRLCRDEQLPQCRTTFYASATSSTSAPWQLLIPFLIAFILPSTIRYYYESTQSWHGSVSFWVSIAFRANLFLIAIFWTLDAADNDEWFAMGNKDLLKTVRTSIAQVVFAIAGAAGTATFAYQAPAISVETRMAPAETIRASKAPGQLPDVSPATFAPAAKPQFVVHGAGNLHGSHFMVLPMTVLLPPLLLLQKPMGQLALSLLALTIFSLLELLALLVSSSPLATNLSPLGPTLLALLAHFAYFKTGHQATLASIQWDTAFLTLRTIRYPWSPLLLAMNTFAGPILCAACVPGVVLWRRPYRFSTSSPLTSDTPDDQDSVSLTPDAAATRRAETRLPQRRALLSSLGSAYATHVLAYAAINLTTTLGAAWLRRHLMLYRVFCPRWMLGGAGMLVAEVAGAVIGVGGVAWSVGAVGRVFGW